MKKIFILALVLVGINKVVYSQVTYTWTGASSTSVSVAGNWTTATGVPTFSPSSTDNIVFDGTSSNNCDFDTDIDVADFSINSGYTGIIDAKSSAPYIGGNFSQATGTFIASDDLIFGMGINGNITITGGTFNHNNGLFYIEVNTGVTNSISGAITFNALQIYDGTGNSARGINFGTATTSSLILDGGLRNFSYQGTIDITSNLTILGTNGTNPASNSGTFNFIGAGPHSIVGSASAGQNRLPNININTTGSISITGHVSLTGSWAGTQGTLTAGTSIVNMYGTSAAISGTAAAFDNLTIQGGASVSMPSNAEVKVGGTLTRSGTLTFQSTTILGLNGSGAQSLAGGSITLGGIHAHGGSRTITLSTPVIILDSLKIDAGVTFNSNGNITLRSNSGGTARLAEIGAGGSFSGNLNVETFIPGGTTGWANLGVRGVSGQVVSSWDTYSVSSGLNGLPMTCVGCAYDPTVTGTGASSFVSIRGYNEATGVYTELVSTDPLTPGVGQWVYVGDGFSATNGLTVLNSGSAVTGSLAVPLTANLAGDNLVANPYASPISWNRVLSHLSQTALLSTNSIYVFNADLGVTTSFNGAASSHFGGITDVIPGGQAFYVEAFSGSNLTFEEGDKVDNTGGSKPLLRPAANSNQLFRLKLQGTNDYDETVFFFHPNSILNKDKLDARKIFQSPGYVGYPGPYDKYTTLSSKDALGNDYSINSMPPLTNSLSVPVLARVSASGSYTLNAFDFQNFPMCVGLIDKLDNSYHDLRLSPYVFNISDTTSTPRFELVMCKDESLNAVGISEASESNSIFITQDAQGAFVKTVFEKNTKATISVYNIIGQKLLNDISVEGMVTNTPLPIDLHNQVVIIKVTTDKESVTKKMVLH